MRCVWGGGKHFEKIYAHPQSVQADISVLEADQ